MRRRSTIIGLVLTAGLWLTALVAAPRGDSATASAVVYAAGSRICHQRPERSFHHEGVQLPVCARCVGLYAGGLLGVVGWAGLAGLRGKPSARTERFTTAQGPRTSLVVMTLPTLISVATAWLGWWDPENALRALLAVPLGIAVGALVCAVAAGDMR